MGAGARSLEVIAGVVRACVAFVLCGFARLREPLLPRVCETPTFITPDEIIQCKTRLPRPAGIYWEYLDEESIAAIPLLKMMKARIGH